jgi:hypothetical protein
MASYYDEHDCKPLVDGEQPNHLLHLASIFAGDRRPPPASKKAVELLPTVKITALQEAQGTKCTVCLVEFEEGEGTRQMPCGHLFHPRCILPWLEKTNSCPLCRHELPTDDADYEEYKKHKARAKQRQFELDTLHDSMFG